MSLRCLFFFHCSTESCEECSRTSIVVKNCRGHLDCTKSNQGNDSSVLCTLQKRKRMFMFIVVISLLSLEKEAEHALWWHWTRYQDFSLVDVGRDAFSCRDLLDVNVLISKFTARPRTEDPEKEKNKSVIHILLPIPCWVEIEYLQTREILVLQRQGV